MIECILSVATSFVINGSSLPYDGRNDGRNEEKIAVYAVPPRKDEVIECVEDDNGHNGKRRFDDVRRKQPDRRDRTMTGYHNKH